MSRQISVQHQHNIIEQDEESGTMFYPPRMCGSFNSSHQHYIRQMGEACFKCVMFERLKAASLHHLHMCLCVLLFFMCRLGASYLPAFEFKVEGCEQVNGPDGAQGVEHHDWYGKPHAAQSHSVRHGQHDLPNLQLHCRFQSGLLRARQLKDLGAPWSSITRKFYVGDTCWGTFSCSPSLLACTGAR